MLTRIALVVLEREGKRDREREGARARASNTFDCLKLEKTEYAHSPFPAFVLVNFGCINEYI